MKVNAVQICSLSSILNDNRQTVATASSQPTTSSTITDQESMKNQADKQNQYGIGTKIPVRNLF